MKQPTLRSVDSIGRIVLPQEMRNAMGVLENDLLALQFNATTGEIVLKRHQPTDGETPPVQCNV